MKIGERQLLVAEYIRLGIDLAKREPINPREIPEFDRERLRRIRELLGLSKKGMLQEIGIPTD